MRRCRRFEAGGLKTCSLGDRADRGHGGWRSPDPTYVNDMPGVNGRPLQHSWCVNLTAAAPPPISPRSGPPGVLGGDGGYTHGGVLCSGDLHTAGLKKVFPLLTHPLVGALPVRSAAAGGHYSCERLVKIGETVLYLKPGDPRRISWVDTLHRLAARVERRCAHSQPRLFWYDLGKLAQCV